MTLKFINKINEKNNFKNSIAIESTNISNELEQSVDGALFKWENIPVPEGYAIDNNGVYKLKWSPDTRKHDKVCICYSPIAISRMVIDIDRDEFYYEVTYTNALGVTSQINIIQEDLIKKTKLINLVNKGINIIDSKARDLCEYFNQSIKDFAKELPLKVLVQSNGWKNGQQTFILGTRMYSESGVQEVIQLNSEETKGLSKKGSLANWTVGVKCVISDPVVRFKCYCVAGTILLYLLDAQSFIAHHAGETSTGKTFSNCIAFSIIGDPNKLKFAGHSSCTFLEETANTYSDLSIFLDEVSIQNVELLTEIIYVLTNGVEKGRGKKDGGVRKVRHYRIGILSTGEKPIIDYEGFGGQQVRAIEIYRKMKQYTPDQIMTANDAINNNYGHVIDYYIRKVFENKDVLKNKYNEYRKKFTNSNLNTANRMGNTFALFALAGEFLEEVLGEIGLETQDNLELTMSFFNEIVKDKPIEPYALRALRFLYDFIEENRYNFVMDKKSSVLHGIGNQERRPDKICGYMQDNCIDIIATKAKDALKKHNFDPRLFKDEWIKWGVLITYADGSDYKPTYHDEQGSAFRPIVWRIDSIKMQDILEKGI